MSFTVTLTTVLVMLAYTIPGYLLVRSGKIPPQSISSFAATLLYLCAPFQTLYAMQQIELSAYMIRHLVLSMALGLFLMGMMLAIVYLMLRRHQREVACRICTVAAAMGNCGFMGLPLLQALMPDYPQSVAFAAAFFFSMTILMWTVVSFIITRDRRYISLKKVFLNPNTIGMAVSLLLFFGGIHLTGQVGGMVELLSRMATPLCMLILGMRLACIRIRSMFTGRLQYLAIGIKLIAFPLFALAVCSLLPVERQYVRTIYIICCVPVGNLVLSFAELLGEGQDVAANVVLLSTFLSMLTIPLMLLII